MIEKGESIEKSVENFPIGAEKKKYDLVEKSVEKSPNQLKAYDLIDFRHSDSSSTRHAVRVCCLHH